MRFRELLIAAVLTSASSQAAPLLSRYSTGNAMLGAVEGRSQITDFEFRLFNGVVEQTQQDIATEERRASGVLYYFLAVPITDTFGFHFTLDADYVKGAREETGGTSISTADWQGYTLEPKALFSYKTPTSVHLYAGLGATYLSENKLSYEIGSISGDTTQEAVHYHYPVFGLAKKTSAWKGTIYAILGREADRKFTTAPQAEGEPPIEGQEPVYQATTYGLSGQTLIKDFGVYLDLASIQAGEGGAQTQDGVTVNEDYNQLSVETRYGSSAAQGLFGFGYKTLSYSSNAFMSLDNIAIMRFTLGGNFGNEVTFAKCGLSYFYGRDRQSLTEFNAAYKHSGYGAFLAFGLGL